MIFPAMPESPPHTSLPRTALLLSLLFTLAVSEARATDQPTPLIARPATTMDRFKMEAFFSYFDGLDLQEAVNLEGWSVGLDFTVPFRRGMQFRFLLPARTDAEGVLVAGGDSIDIKGWGGTFDFATLYFEHQISGVDGGTNRFSYFFGYGFRTAPLETNTPDKYNHDGRSVHAGVRYDRILEHSGVLIFDAELRSYEASDDLNPGSLTDDRFNLGRFTGAWLAGRRGAVTPGVELTADVSHNYFAAILIPELIIDAGNRFDLKVGVPLGLSADAADWGVRLNLSLSL